MDEFDLQLLGTGACVLYYQMSVLNDHTDRLKLHGYQVVTLDSRQWTSMEAFHQAVSSALRFPEYYGGNLNALNDCLRDVEFPATGRLALRFHHYDSFARAFPRPAQAVLDILEVQARIHLLRGKRLLMLIQSDDPAIEFAAVGARPMHWNDSEWLNERRGPPGA